ncbi:unnamed protein product, partial [Ectocarpus sp. 12 AP-2014]
IKRTPNRRKCAPFLEANDPADREANPPVASVVHAVIGMVGLFVFSSVFMRVTACTSIWKFSPLPRFSETSFWQTAAAAPRSSIVVICRSLLVVRHPCLSMWENKLAQPELSFARRVV